MRFFEVRRCQAFASPVAVSLSKMPSQHPRVVSVLSPTSVTIAILVLAGCAVPCLAGTVQQVTDLKTTGVAFVGPSVSPVASLDDAGTAVYVNASTNQLGGNPEARYQVFRFDAATGAGQQITSFSKGVSNKGLTVSVSDDGQWVAFVSKADPVGQNHDASDEVFVMHPDGTGIAQVTNDPSVTAPPVLAAVLSGLGNRIVFRSRGNPLGTNPTNREQLFIVDRDGTGLRQLTATTAFDSWRGLSISDDGQRIVFATTANLTGNNADKGSEVYAIQADGTNLRQITASPSVPSELPAISGDGSKIAFASGSTREIYAINWDGTGLQRLTFSIGGQGSTSPSITDDGQVVFFSAFATGTGKTEVWKIKTDATGLTQLTSAGGADLIGPSVSGGGSRVAFAGTTQPANSSGVSGELGVMTKAGTNRLQLVITRTWGITTPAISRDGTRIVFSSNMDPFGTNPEGDYEIFRIQADGSGLFQVTSGGGFYPSITADGNTIVFESSGDLGGQNPGHDSEIFRINADGTGVQRLTYSFSPPYEPKISANGSVVVFYTNAFQIGVVNADGTGQMDLTGPPGSSTVPSVDDTGTWITFMSSGNLTGDNPNGMNQIYRMRTDGSVVQRVSTDATRHDWYPEISGAGTRIVYMSSADPVGSNPNHYDQLFTYDTTTSQTHQLTAATGTGTAALPATISGDGNWVVLLASANWAEPNPMFNLNLYRVPATGGPTERIGAGPTSAFGGTGNTFVAVYKPHADMTGTRIVFGGGDDPTAQNGDYSSDLWTVDMAKEPAIHVSRASPTLVSWDYEAGPIRYDIIRGDVDNLAPGLPGTVDLGPVACLENDSPDTDTRGFEDPVMPPAGHAFFFLFRGSRGLNFGPGTWGQASGGAERTPGLGVCAP